MEQTSKLLGCKEQENPMGRRLVHGEYHAVFLGDSGSPGIQAGPLDVCRPGNGMQWEKGGT